MKQPFKLVISVVVCELAGLISTPFTISAIDTWYRFLNKPFFSPPNWVFGPVWTILYALMGVAAYLIWIKGSNTKKVKMALILFLVQLALNMKWSILFFALHAPFLALIEITILWFVILITMVKFYDLSKTATYLLVPYLLWVTFATLLNTAIVVLNP